MPKRDSALAKLWNSVTSLAVLAALAWIAWYGYSQLEPTSSEVREPGQKAKYNCRKALAERESDYACVNSDSCTMTPDELIEMKNRDADIDKNCNLGLNPLPDVVL